jgi:small-conductance mechanosensitive channel
MLLLFCTAFFMAPALAQESAGGEAPPEGSVVIDPSATEGISVTQGEGPEQVEPDGPVGKLLDDSIPETGIETVDVSVNKFSKAVSDMTDTFIASLPNLIIAFFVLLLGWLMANLVSKLIRKISTKARLRNSLADLFALFGRVAVWFVAFLIAAGIIFPGFGFGQLVATAGLASIAVGLAFQDIFENFFAGILILWKFPIENGDFIEVDGLMGKVEDVEIRMTYIRQTNGELVLVPNSMIFKNKVTVLTNRPHRRLELSVGIAYGEDVAEGRKLILEAVKGCDTVRNDTEPEVLAVEFGASSINFDVIWWADSAPIKARRSKDQVIEAIKAKLDEAGIEIPYPYRTLTFSPNEPDIIKAVQGRTQSGGASDEDAGD